MKDTDMSFKGILASSMGVIVSKQPLFPYAKERVEEKTVPGRTGSLHLTQGDYVYDDVILSPTLTLRPTADRDQVGAWLRGSGRVIFGSRPAYAYEGYIYGEITPSAILEGTNWDEITVTFKCDPRRYEAVPRADVQLTASGFVQNNGTLPADPVVYVTGSGESTLVIGGTILNLSLGSTSTTIRIDTRAMEVTNEGMTEYKNACLTGDFPVLPVGNVPVSWTGAISKVRIIPNICWR